MKKFEKVIEEKHTDTLCDICEISLKKFPDDTIKIKHINSDFYLRKGTNYPIGGIHTKKIHMDVCPNCFKDKILTLSKNPIKYNESYNNPCLT